MIYRFHYRRYRLPFRLPVRTAHGLWAEREGILIRLEDESGVVGWGEAAPIPGFGTGTVDEMEAGCRELGETLDDERMAGVPAELGCLRHALTAARTPAAASAHKYLAVAALLPAGRGAVARAQELAESGFRVFKWKVGVGELTEELGLLDDICAVLPSGAKIRLDANGAWDRRRAERWLERCSERPVEFVEQPAFAGPTAGRPSGSPGKETDLLLGLAGAFPTPIALDESIVGEGDVERWLGVGWPGIFVVKPSLLGDVAGCLAQLAKARADVVFSSALETAVGARGVLGTAFAWPGGTSTAEGAPPRALGFGVWPLFGDDRFNGPATAPFLRAEDVERINVEAAWNALN